MVSTGSAASIAVGGSLCVIARKVIPMRSADLSACGGPACHCPARRMTGSYEAG